MTGDDFHPSATGGSIARGKEIDGTADHRLPSLVSSSCPQEGERRKLLPGRLRTARANALL